MEATSSTTTETNFLSTEEVTMAMAAEAAAQALSDNDKQTAQLCRICQRGEEDGRAMLRFLGVEHEFNTAAAAPNVTTFTEDFALHVFCGKTANILPHVQRPDLEILTKAGIKNKHGIGPEVNAALAKTRSAALEDGRTKKQYFLVREFEAHLAVIRRAHLEEVDFNHADIVHDNTRNDRVSHASNTVESPPSSSSSSSSSSATDELAGFTPQEFDNPHEMDVQLADLFDGVVPTTQPVEYKVVAPHRASRVQAKHRPTSKASVASSGLNSVPLQSPSPTLDDVGIDTLPNGKIRCQCGGSHGMGTNSWQTHLMTKRHHEWVEQQDKESLQESHSF